MKVTGDIVEETVAQMKPHKKDISQGKHQLNVKYNLVKNKNIYVW